MGVACTQIHQQVTAMKVIIDVSLYNIDKLLLFVGLGGKVVTTQSVVRSKANG